MVVNMEKTKLCGPLRISLAQDEIEQEEALTFINGVALERHNSAPPPPPQIIIVAKQNSQVVGTISLDFGDNNHPLPLEKIYQFDRCNTPLPFRSGDVAQIGRWMVTIKGASAALLHTATVYALRSEKKYGLFETKESVAVRLRTLGLQLLEIPGAKFNIENVPEVGRPYYATPPPPSLYIACLESAENVLRKIVLPQTSSGEIILDQKFTERLSRREAVTSKDSVPLEIRESIERTMASYQEVAIAYDIFSAPFHAAVTYPKIIKELENYLSSLPGKQILDVGCGSGKLMQVLNERGAQCSGIDITPAFLDIARSRGLWVIQGSMHNLPFPDEMFDAVVSNYVLNYLPAKGQRMALQEKFRVLRRDGIMIFSYMHPFFMRATPYQEQPPHYLSSTKNYFEPAREILINQLGQKFTLYLLDWPEITNMVIESGFCLLELTDAKVPDQLERIAAEINSEAAADFVKGFRYNPYAIFVTAKKRSIVR
jgi:ubiquinone/menaquinone biosynthesis C-methylase UbiE